MLLRRLVSLAAVVAACSCSWSCAGPRLGPVREVTSHAASLLAGAPTVIGPDATKIPASPADDRVRATLEGAIPAAARASLRHEPALDLVARVAADIAGAEKQPPSAALLEWLFWRAGAVSRYAHIEVMVADGTDDLDLQTADYAGRVQASVYPESFGVARSSRGRAAQVIVFGRRLVDVDPMPKSYAPGAPITIKARPLDAFTELSLLADGEDGNVVEEKLAADGGAFTITRKAPTKPGRYFIELTGLDARTSASVPENPWRRTLFLAPIYVGVPESSAPDAFVMAPAAVTDAAAWASKVTDGYNAARTKAGKQPIASDGRLSTLAQERAGVVARAGREPPPDVVLADKIAASGHPPHDYDVMEARVDSPEDYVALRLLVPSVRRRVLSADALLVGLGLAPRPATPSKNPDAKPASASEQALVEVVVEPVGRMDPAQDRSRVLAALDERAKAEGRKPYKHDEDVAKALQQFADDVCRGQTRPNQMKLLVDKARGVGEKYKQWGTPVWRAGYDFKRWQEASVLAKTKEAPLAYAEAGLCQGNMPGKPGGAYVVVLQFSP